MEKNPKTKQIKPQAHLACITRVGQLCWIISFHGSVDDDCISCLDVLVTAQATVTSPLSFGLINTCGHGTVNCAQRCTWVLTQGT